MSRSSSSRSGSGGTSSSKHHRSSTRSSGSSSSSNRHSRPSSSSHHSTSSSSSGGRSQSRSNRHSSKSKSRSPSSERSRSPSPGASSPSASRHHRHTNGSSGFPAPATSSSSNLFGSTSYAMPWTMPTSTPLVPPPLPPPPPPPPPPVLLAGGGGGGTTSSLLTGGGGHRPRGNSSDDDDDGIADPSAISSSSGSRHTTHGSISNASIPIGATMTMMPQNTNRDQSTGVVHALVTMTKALRVRLNLDLMDDLWGWIMTIRKGQRNLDAFRKELDAFDPPGRDRVEQFVMVLLRGRPQILYHLENILSNMSAQYALADLPMVSFLSGAAPPATKQTFRAADDVPITPVIVDMYDWIGKLMRRVARDMHVWTTCETCHDDNSGGAAWNQTIVKALLKNAISVTINEALPIPCPGESRMLTEAIEKARYQNTHLSSSLHVYCAHREPWLKDMVMRMQSRQRLSEQETSASTKCFVEMRQTMTRISADLKTQQTMMGSVLQEHARVLSGIVKQFEDVMRTSADRLASVPSALVSVMQQSRTTTTQQPPQQPPPPTPTIVSSPTPTPSATATPFVSRPAVIPSSSLLPATVTATPAATAAASLPRPMSTTTTSSASAAASEEARRLVASMGMNHAATQFATMARTPQVSTTTPTGTPSVPAVRH